MIIKKHNSQPPLQIVLCGTGSLASINLPGCTFELASQTGYQVHVVTTGNALRFTTRRALKAMSGRKVWQDDFLDETEDGMAPHVALTEHASIVVVYPATANFIAKIAHGFADELASAVVLCAACPVLIVPNMHIRMWENPATRANVKTLEQRGFILLKPGTALNAKNEQRGVSVSVSEVVNAVRRMLSDHSSSSNKVVSQL